MTRFVASIMLVVCVGGVVHAKAPLDALVVSVSGRSVYINAGRNARIASGARVVFSLTTGERIEATIVDVAASSARAELSEGSLVPAINDRAEVEVEVAVETSAAVPGGTSQQPAGTPEATPIPTHPPWSRQEGQRTSDTPLLAPAFGTSPKERPTVVKGRVFTNVRVTRDLENASTFTYMRAGTWLEVHNPFGDGGRILFEADTDYRNSGTSGGDTSDQNSRLKRLSYAWGLDQHATFRGEAGRFYSQTLPEIGLIDGGEAAIRFEDGWSIGGGAGMYPSPSDTLNSGDDYGFHLFADYQAEDDNRWLQSTAGFQQTWHLGEVDRSLVIGRVNVRPNTDLSIFGSLLVDLYGPGDTVKTQVADITQLVAQATYQLDPKAGINGSFTRTTWPELKRDEFVNLPPELIADGFVNRASGSACRKVGDEVRLTGRAHYWTDQDRTGHGAEASADWNAGGESNESYYGSVYYEDSTFTKGVGARLQGRRDLGPVRVFAGYDVFGYSTNTLFAGDGNFLRHSLRASVNWSRGKWSWDIETGYTFGTSEESLNLGAYVQYRF